MVNRINKHVTGELDKLNENDTQAVLSYISQLLSSRRSQSKDNSANDDLIGSLSDAYETRRARQAVEWERLGRQNIQRAV